MNWARAGAFQTFFRLPAYSASAWRGRRACAPRCGQCLAPTIQPGLADWKAHCHSVQLPISPGLARALEAPVYQQDQTACGRQEPEGQASDSLDSSGARR